MQSVSRRTVAGDLAAADDDGGAGDGFGWARPPDVFARTRTGCVQQGPCRRAE